MVAVNGFPGTAAHDEAAVRDALSLGPDTPILRMDARGPQSCLTALITLVEHALARTALPEPA